MRAQARTVAALNKSESHYRQARSILDTLGASSAKRLADIPAAESVRQDILAQTIGYYEQFIDSSNSDPLLRHDVARTRLEIARLTALSSDYDSADKAYHSAWQSLSHTTNDRGNEHRSFKRLENTPSLGDHRRGLVATPAQLTSLQDLLLYIQVLNEWALLASEHGDQSSAQARLQTALEALAQPPLCSAEDRLKLNLARALSHNNLGVVQLRLGQTAQSAQQIKQSIALLKEVPSELLRDAQMGSDLADAFSNLSVLLGQVERYAEAAQAAEQSLALRTTAQPARTIESRSRSAVTYNNLAAFHWQSQRTAEAIIAYERAVDLLEQVIRQAPGRMDAHHRLAITLNNLGMAFITQGATEQAERVLERAETLARPAVAADSSDVQAARRLAGILNNQAVLMRGEQRFTEAEQRLLAAAELLRGIPVAIEQRHANAVQDVSLQIQSNLDNLALPR